MINIVGLGYIGLPTALIFAANGVKVTGTDYNAELVEKLKQDLLTFEELGIENLFEKARNAEIYFTTKYIETDVYIIAVPTPFNIESKKIDPMYVISAVEEIVKVCPKGAIIVIESTVSPGTIDKYVRPVLQKKQLIIGKDVHLVHAPERIIPGNMIYELEHNSRTIGADDQIIGERIKTLYSSFCKGEIIVTDIRTAEMTKVVENTFRDINIAYANELTKICRSDNMNVYEIIRIANKHPRVNILQPGPGVGGHCISVDPWFLVGDYPGLANIILAARKINDSMPDFVLKRIYDIMQENNIMEVAKVGLYGLTYKEDVDDVRESPTLQVLDSMKRHLASGIKVYDPWVKDNLVNNQYHDLDEFLNDIDLVIIMVSHSEIKQNMQKLENKIVLDTRGGIIASKVYLL